MCKTKLYLLKFNHLNPVVMRRNLMITFLFSIATSLAFAQNSTTIPAMKKKILVHITQGPDDPTRAALGFLVAKTALEEGHEVNIFLAGDGVKLLQDAVLDSLTGLGTGKLREHYDSIVKNKGKFYLSGNSSKARGLTEADLAGKPAEFALPSVLVRLSIESDRMFTY
jgi:predicted peroxiredoxin